MRYRSDMDIGVVGGSGYAGGELLRLLSDHPNFKVVQVCAGTSAGELITTIHPNLLNFGGQRSEEHTSELQSH